MKMLQTLNLISLFFVFSGNLVAADVPAYSAILKLAEQGNIFAQYDMAFKYYDGEGVPQDYKEAAKWYTKAAEQGNDAAQFNLGVMYYLGRGMPQDYIQAHKLWNLAAANGNEGAIKNRNALTEQMTPEQIAEAQKLAREWYEKHQAKE